MRDLAFALSAGAILGVGALCFTTALHAADHAFFTRYQCPPQKDVAKTDAKTLEYVVDAWRLDDYATRKTQCPSIELLKYYGALKADQNTNDPWGMPYIVFCPHDEDVTVMSAGPDRRYGTADDVTAGAAP